MAEGQKWMSSSQCTEERCPGHVSGCFAVWTFTRIARSQSQRYSSSRRQCYRESTVRREQQPEGSSFWETKSCFGAPLSACVVSSLCTAQRPADPHLTSASHSLLLSTFLFLHSQLCPTLAPDEIQFLSSTLRATGVWLLPALIFNFASHKPTLLPHQTLPHSGMRSLLHLCEQLSLCVCLASFFVPLVSWSFRTLPQSFSHTALYLHCTTLPALYNPPTN